MHDFLKLKERKCLSYFKCDGYFLKYNGFISLQNTYSDRYVYLISFSKLYEEEFVM